MDPTGLRIVTPAGETVLPPDREHVVGRGRDCDVVLADGRVSRRHLRLEPGGDGWLARDISSNGIWVNGTRRVSVPPHRRRGPGAPRRRERPTRRSDPPTPSAPPARPTRRP
ncbi:FHA domain-containing protein [Frankia sp. ArI3]|uniref:FHA domain-containing protein n=1 Tax=Frankia sp. ArI3 TaxID=1858 RepID=UPI00351CDB74